MKEPKTQTEPVAPEVQTATVEPSLAPVPAQATGGAPSAASPAQAIAAQEAETGPMFLMPAGVSIAKSDGSIPRGDGEQNISAGDVLFHFEDGDVRPVPMSAFRDLIGR